MKLQLRMWNEEGKLFISGELEGRKTHIKEFLEAIIEANLKEEQSRRQKK